MFKYATPLTVGAGFGANYYAMLERAFSGATINSGILRKMMLEYECTRQDLLDEKEAIEAKAVELATTHCAKVNAQIEKYHMEFMGIDCGSSRVAPVEQDGHTADHGRTSVDVGTVLVETRPAV